MLFNPLGLKVIDTIKVQDVFNLAFSIPYFIHAFFDFSVILFLVMTKCFVKYIQNLFICQVGGYVMSPSISCYVNGLSEYV